MWKLGYWRNIFALMFNWTFYERKKKVRAGVDRRAHLNSNENICRPVNGLCIYAQVLE